ncbi:hypothetical protein L9G15_09800 [Shewanella sp. A3A]|nr:hypothetical protein [Shewanella ferrihydritica]
MSILVRIKTHGERGIFSKNGWLEESSIQLRSSNLLREIGEDALGRLEKISCSDQKMDRAVVGIINDREAVNKTSYLLLGYAFELLLKGGILSMYVHLPKQLFDNDIRREYGHNLKKMAEELEIGLSNDDVLLLENLEKDIIDFARYPISNCENKDFTNAINNQRIRFSNNELYGKYVQLYEHIKGKVLKVNSSSDDPAFSLTATMDEDGYFIYMSGGTLSNRMVYKFSTVQKQNGEDNKEKLYEFLINNLDSLVLKSFVERDWLTAKHRVHKVRKNKHYLEPV